MSLESLGYTFVPGATGDPSDWVLRQAADTSKGFEWKGQENCAYFPPPGTTPRATSLTHTHTQGSRRPRCPAVAAPVPRADASNDARPGRPAN